MSRGKQKVVIIGGGAAGIAAATRLYENGIKDVLVLEAEDRIGGRVRTVELKDHCVVELGAQWIHGEERNVCCEIASARNMYLHSDITMDVMSLVRSSGEVINSELSDRLWAAFHAIQEDLQVSDLMQYRSSGDFFISKTTKVFESQENCEIPLDLRDEFIELCHQNLNSYDGCDTWFDSSASSLTEYRECPGDHYGMWKGGYRNLFLALLEKCQNLSDGKFISENVITNTEVKRILLDSDGVVKIECDNGRAFSADHVIVTVSLGVLQEIHETLFEGLPLSEEKIRAINGLTLGSVDKIFLKFPRQWWSSERGGFGLLWTKEDREEFIKLGLEWVTNVFAFTRVDHAPLVLCGWISGPSARTMELIDEKDVQEILMQVLRKFFANEHKIPDPDDFSRSTWASNKHFRGSYSLRSTKTDELGVSASLLATPIMNKQGIPIVLFAGEAAHNHYYSTVHGAVESGWREANRIIALDK